MISSISERVRSLRPDIAQGKPALRVVPICGPSADEPSYRLLEGDALSAVRVLEINSGGSVPELKVENSLDERVYLMDGQELIGAKQNRILNTDVLIPAKATVTIPVSCVEAHRWRYVSGAFSPGKTASHTIRSRKQSRVHLSLKHKSSHDADQGAVWNEVSMSMRSSGTSSDTAALHDAYTQREKDLSEFREALHIPEQTVGLAVFRGRQFLGLDLFDRHATLVYFWKNLLDSYAIDWLFAAQGESGQEPTEDLKVVQANLELAANGQWEKFTSPGEGDDYRLEDSTLTGSSLIWKNRTVVHLQLFPQVNGSR